MDRHKPGQGRQRSRLSSPPAAGFRRAFAAAGFSLSTDKPMATRKAAAKPANEMTVVDRAAHVLKFDQLKPKLTELAKQSERIVEITNAAGKEECHAARMELKNTRVEIQRAGKIAREDATAFSKAVIAKEKELIDLISPEEDRLQGLQDVWESAREAERAEKARAERARVEAEQAALRKIRELPLTCIGQSSEQIQKWIDATVDIDLEDIPEGVRAQAAELAKATVEQLTVMRDLKRDDEQEAQRLADERAELERQRKAQEAEQAEQARIAREQREQADRDAAAERKRLDDEAKAERDRQAAELKAEQDRAAEAQRAAAAVEQEKRDAEAAEQRRQHEEAEATLKRERDEFERKRAEAEKAERDRAIADATLISAAGEAVDLLTDSGFGSHLVTLKLSAALARETHTEAKEAA